MKRCFCSTVQAKRQPYLQLQTVPSSESNLSTASTALKDFPLLSAKLAEQNIPNQSTSTAADARSLRSHLNQYINDISTNSISTSAIAFWHHKQESKVYSVLPLIAQDYVSAPASQAFVERLFSVCGILTAGRRNRMEKSLNMRAWLKVNHSELADIGNGFS